MNNLKPVLRKILVFVITPIVISIVLTSIFESFGLRYELLKCGQMCGFDGDCYVDNEFICDLYYFTDSEPALLLAFGIFGFILVIATKFILWFIKR